MCANNNKKAMLFIGNGFDFRRGVYVGNNGAVAVFFFHRKNFVGGELFTGAAVCRCRRVPYTERVEIAGG